MLLLPITPNGVFLIARFNMVKKPDEFTIWLKEAIEKLDGKVEKGFKETNDHLAKLNGTVLKQQIEIDECKKWEDGHDKTSRMKYADKIDLVKIILGGGGIAGAIVSLTMIMLQFYHV